MLNLLFLLGEKRPAHFSSGEDLLTNILDRFSLTSEDYLIEYCYDYTPASKKIDRVVGTVKRREQLVSDLKSETVIVGMGWMATELLTGVSKTNMTRFIGCRFPIAPFKYDTWFSYDPAAALFDPNMYVDIMGVVSAAIRYSGRPIQIDTKVKPFVWNNL